MKDIGLRTEASTLYDGNMSFDYGAKNDVFAHRIDFSLRYNFSLFSHQEEKVIPHGFAPRMVHGSNILVIREADRQKYDGHGIMERSSIECDAVITECLDFPLLFPNADCFPIVLHDPTIGILATVHGGRQPVLNGLLFDCVEAMRREFGCLPANLTARIFTGICSRCYVLNELRLQIPNYLERFVLKAENGFSLNILGMIIHQLSNSDISNIHLPRGRNICTCHTTAKDGQAMFFSSYGYLHRQHFPWHKSPGENALLVEMSNGG